MTTRISATGRVIVDLDAVDIDQAKLRAQVEKRAWRLVLQELATTLARRAYRNIEFKTLRVDEKNLRTAKAIFLIVNPLPEAE